MYLEETENIRLQNLKLLIKYYNMVKVKQTKNNKNQKTSKTASAKAVLTWLPKKTFQLELTIPWDKAKNTYDSTLKGVAKQMSIKGFRKGKAPIKLVEQNIDKQKLYQEVIKKLLPETFEKEVKKQNLRPIINPKIAALSLKEKQDWKFKATSCEAPEIKLNSYEKTVKGELAKTKIWTPDKGKPDKKDEKEKTHEQKLRIVTKSLLDNIKAEISDLLIDDEVSRMLSKLLDQVNTLGITIEQYLASRGQTSQQLKQQYRKQAEDTLRLEFILQAVVKDKNIKIEDKDIDKMIEATPDEKVRKQLNSPVQRAYISSILAKRKALDYLINL